MLLVEALAAYGDMAIVLTHHGSVATALGVHGLLLMHEPRKITVAAATHAPQPV